MGDIREHIKGPFRLRVGKAHTVQAGTDIVPSSPVQKPHRLRINFQRRFRCCLQEGGHCGNLRRTEQQQPGEQFFRADEIAHPPAGHGIGLGEALAEDGLGAQVLPPRQVAAGGIDQLVVDIVTDQVDVFSQHRPGDGIQAALPQNDPRGIAGGIEDDGLRLLRQAGIQGFLRDLEVRFGHIQKDRLGSCRRDNGGIQGEGGCWDDHLVPGVQDAGEGGIQGLGGPHRHQYLFRGSGSSPVRFKGGNGGAQRGRALVWGIVGFPPGKGFQRRLTDGLRGSLVRLADGEHPAVRGGLGQIGEHPNAAALQGVQVVVNRHHWNFSANSSKKSAPFTRTSSLKLKVSEWRAEVSPTPRKKNMPGRDF